MTQGRAFLGVRFDPSTGRYQATFRGAFLGRYQTAKEASIAWDRAALASGANIRLHFPREAQRLGPASAVDLRAELVATLRRQNKASYIGVRKAGRSYDAYTSVDRRDLFLGRFKRSRDAAIAHDRVQRYLRPKSVLLNFPGMKVDPISPEALRRELHQAFKEATSSRYEGVSYDGRDLERPWAAHITVRRQSIFLGRWASERDAAVAHDRAALHHGATDHRLNVRQAAEKVGPADAESLIAQARGEKKKGTSSRFLGVCFHKGANKWSASCSRRDEKHHLGLFDDEGDAAIAYDKAVIALRGDAARVNFHPTTGEPAGGRRLKDLSTGDPPARGSRTIPAPSRGRSTRATTTPSRTRPRARSR